MGSKTLTRQHGRQDGRRPYSNNSPAGTTRLATTTHICQTRTTRRTADRTATSRQSRHRNRHWHRQYCRQPPSSRCSTSVRYGHMSTRFRLARLHTCRPAVTGSHAALRGRRVPLRLHGHVARVRSPNTGSPPGTGNFPLREVPSGMTARAEKLCLPPWPRNPLATSVRREPDRRNSAPPPSIAPSPGPRRPAPSSSARPGDGTDAFPGSPAHGRGFGQPRRRREPHI